MIVSMKEKKICIVMSTYNDTITSGLLSFARSEFEESKVMVKRFKLHLIKVPGAFEIPITISKLAKKFDGFIAIGCIIKGKTANFDLICNAITNAIMQISVSEKKPIGNAILTCFNEKQALDRLDKGGEAAKAVISVLESIRKGPEHLLEREPV